MKKILYMACGEIIEFEILKVWYKKWGIKIPMGNNQNSQRQKERQNIYEGLGASGEYRPFSDSTDIEGSKNLGFLARGYGGRGSEYGSPVNSDDYGDESNP